MLCRRQLILMLGLKWVCIRLSSGMGLRGVMRMIFVLGVRVLKVFRTVLRCIVRGTL